MDHMNHYLVDRYKEKGLSGVPFLLGFIDNFNLI
jgi:hypothetical protein